MLVVLGAVFVAICRDLNVRACGLLCTSAYNIEVRSEVSFPCFYLLMPAQTGQSFVAKVRPCSKPCWHPPANSSEFPSNPVCLCPSYHAVVARGPERQSPVDNRQNVDWQQVVTFLSCGSNPQSMFTSVQRIAAEEEILVVPQSVQRSTWTSVPDHITNSVASCLSKVSPTRLLLYFCYV
jgi:hypothetical protein